MRGSSRDPAPWIVVIFAINFFLQRLSIPGTTITVTVPLSLAWAGLAVHLRVLEINRVRLMLWLSAAALGALVVIPQLLFVASPFVSVNSWAFWMSIWLPGVTQLVDRSREQYLRCLRTVAQVGLVISGFSVLFILLQLLGVPYRDWLLDIFPPSIVVPEFATSYPVSYGSTLYKSNAWFALEPSYLSFILGACTAAAIFARVHPLKVFFLLMGVLASTAGSGMAIICVAVVGLALSRGRGALKRYVIPAVVIAVITAATPVGQAVLSRVTEASTQGSSASRRGIEPYAHLWPQWVNDPYAVLFGRGAGSSRWLIDQDPEEGLLVPIAAKMLFDYGLVAGGLLLVLIVFMYLRSGEPILAIALAASMLIQEAGQPLVLCTLTLITIWSPRTTERCAADSPPVRLGQFAGSTTLTGQRSLVPTRRTHAWDPPSEPLPVEARGVM